MASKHNNSEAHQQNDKELRIVMVGKTGIGKSATGNTILGRECFYSKFSASSMTDECSKGTSTVDGQKVAVIDSPGLFDTRFDEDKTKKNISQCISYCSPGPHVFLVVIRLGRFTEEEKQTVQKIQEMFGEAADRYSMVLFTHGDLLGDTTIEEFMEESKGLKDLIARCGGLYHVFNNKLKERSQVTELLQKISDLVKKNGGNHYTSEMFQEAERKLEEETQQILKEKEEQIRKEKKELEMKLRAEFEVKLRRVTEKLQAELEEEKKKREKEKQEREKEFMKVNIEMNDLKREAERLHNNNREMEMAIKREKQAMERRREQEIKREKEERGEWGKIEEEIKREREEREKEQRKIEIKREREEREKLWRKIEIKREREEREKEWRKREKEMKREREEREELWSKREKEIKRERDEREKQWKIECQRITAMELQMKKEFERKLDDKFRDLDEKHQHLARQQAEKKNPVFGWLKKFYSFFR